MRTAPNNIRQSAHDLTPEGLAELFVLTLKNGTIFRMSPKSTWVWQGNTYEAIPCSMSSVEVEVGGKVSRPQFSIVNPEGMFTAYMYGGLLNNATLTRIRILYTDLVANNNFSLTENFSVSQLLSVSKKLIVLSLRDVFDGNRVIFPNRMYLPPEFPHVKL